MEAALQPIEQVLKRIPGSLDVWTEVENGVRSVESVHHLDKEGHILLGLFSAVKGDRWRLYTKDTSALATTASSNWVPMAHSSPNWNLNEADISRVWVARPDDRRQSIFSSRATNFIHQMIVLAGDVLYTVTVDDTAGYPFKYAAVEHLRVPEYLDADSLQVAWNPRRQLVVLAFGEGGTAAGGSKGGSGGGGGGGAPVAHTGGTPIILPISDAKRQSSKSLYYHSPSLNGWRPVCAVGVTAEYLSLSGYGNRCVWREMLNAEAPEEAERGEFYGADVPAPVLAETEQGNVSRRGFGQVLAQRDAGKTQLTQGAGRVDWARLNADGTAVALLANFEKHRPITTHRDLFLVEWPAAANSRGEPVAGPGQSEISAPVRVTDPAVRAGGSIEDFGWVALHRETKASASTASDIAAAVHATSIGAASRGVVAARAVGKNEEARAEGMLWTSEIRGCERRGRVLHLQLNFSTRGPPRTQSMCVHDLRCAPVCGGGVRALLLEDTTTTTTGGGGGGEAAGATRQLALAFGTETDVLWPHVCTTRLKTLPPPLRPGVVVAPAPAPDDAHNYGKVGLHGLPKNNQLRFDDLAVEKVQWKSRDGQALEGLLFEQRSSPPQNPLLVNAHGGPAGAFAADRTAAANSTRYPFRHFLKAGYRVFQPLYRGTLGYGDEFAQANIQRQGGVDLGDIASGVRHLLATHPRVQCPASDVGIFGGSYGGYLTLRALSKLSPVRGEEPPIKYAAGVAEYGFLHNRWMTYEGGDFSWENEYVGDATKFPQKKVDNPSDVFDSLASVRAPCLLMHGEDDDICPVSQSRVGYNILRHSAKVPTGLIVYPGEGHGFSQPAHRRDRDRRMLVWFLTYLPVVPLEERVGGGAGAAEPVKTSAEAAAELEGRELHPHELALKLQSAVADVWGSSLREAFLAVDTNRDGIIDRRELEALLARQNLNRFPAETAALLDAIDVNGDGRLSFEEFSSMLQSTSLAQSRVSEAQDGFRQPATNFYEREAERQRAQRAREAAEAARWAQPRAFSGANTASSVILGQGDDPNVSAASALQNRKFAGANTASSLTFGDAFTTNRRPPPPDVSHTQATHQERVLSTPLPKPSIRTGAFAGANTASSVSFGGPETQQQRQQGSPFDPSSFVSSAARRQSAAPASAADAGEGEGADSTALLRAKPFAGRNAASSIAFTDDGLVSNNETAPGPLSSVRTAGAHRTASNVAMDHGDQPDFARKGAANPAEFLSRVAAANSSPRHGQRRQSGGEHGHLSPRRARSPPRERRYVESSLTVQNGALVSRREQGPARPVRALSPGKTQASQYEIAEAPGPVPYKPLRRAGSSDALKRSSDPATFLSHHGRGEHRPPPRSNSHEPADPARVVVGGVQAAAAGSAYAPPVPKSQAEVMMRHDPTGKQFVNRFAGKSQESRVVMNPEEAARRPNTPRSTRRNSAERTASKLVFG